MSTIQLATTTQSFLQFGEPSSLCLPFSDLCVSSLLRQSFGSGSGSAFLLKVPGLLLRVKLQAELVALLILRFRSHGPCWVPEYRSDRKRVLSTNAKSSRLRNDRQPPNSSVHEEPSLVGTSQPSGLQLSPDNRNDLAARSPLQLSWTHVSRDSNNSLQNKRKLLKTPSFRAWDPQSCSKNFTPIPPNSCQFRYSLVQISSKFQLFYPKIPPLQVQKQLDCADHQYLARIQSQCLGFRARIHQNPSQNPTSNLPTFHPKIRPLQVFLLHPKVLALKLQKQLGCVQIINQPWSVGDAELVFVKSLLESSPMGGGSNACRLALIALGNRTRPRARGRFPFVKSANWRICSGGLPVLMRSGDGARQPDASSYAQAVSVPGLFGARATSERGLSTLSGGGKVGSKGKCIKKILIANRGEIACRVIRTAQKLGVRTVAVYSEADRGAKHVDMADEAVFIGPALASASYLDGAKILATALATGADAIHPGYGFLSESSKFAELCKQKEIIFMGPPAAAIRAMGDKSVAKSMMSAAGVPVVPGYHGEDQGPELLQAEANRIGYPVLIKATQGGGGKGMRIVHNESDFLESLASAQRESQAAFGDCRVLIEKYVSRPRHIEVQIFADKHGNAVHLNERDCSVQRRHQKIIEEAPAPNITSEFRQRIGQAAVDAAKAVGYESAGTVEFIVDTVSGDFYFMEMNTRLQVEHPVTEMVTGQDLVEWQIRVANGEVLPLQQSEIKLMGHSFEARIYAENVPKGFLPAAGLLHHYNPPSASPTVRVETGVGKGDTVSVFYDPMIAKLVVWGRDRSSALTKLVDSLTKFQIAGLPTNIGFLKTLASHHAFAAGDVDTHFIDRFKADLLPSTQSDSIQEPLVPNLTQYGAALAAAAFGIKSTQERSDGLNSIWSSGSGFRLNHAHTRMVHLDWKSELADSTAVPLSLKVTYGKAGNFVVEGDKVEKMSVTGKELLDDSCNLRLNVNGKTASVSLAQFHQGGLSHVHLWEGNQHHHFTMPVAAFDTDDTQEHQRSSHGQHERCPAQGPGAIVAPMAGRVVKIFVATGARVKKGDSILVLEAMKMEHVVKSPIEGIVKGAELEVGQQVSDSTILCQIEVQDA